MANSASKRLRKPLQETTLGWIWAGSMLAGREKEESGRKNSS
jgi:hypothetical protein